MASKENVKVYQTRLHQLIRAFKNLPCDLLLIDHPVDIYYLTGQKLSAAKLLIDTKGTNLIADGRYYERVKKQSPFPVELLAKNGLETHLNHPRYQKKHALGFIQETTTYNTYLKLKKTVKSTLKHGRLIPIENPLIPMREVKDALEITLLKKAAQIGSLGFRFACSQLQVGITEETLSRKLEIFWKEHGIEEVSFSPIIAFGESSANPHHHPGKRRLKQGDTVLIDLGVKYQGYCSDMTRSLFFGEPNPTMKTIYQIVQTAQKNALDRCQDGVTIAEVDHAARDFIEKQGYAEYFTHALGHGLGLEVHESPCITMKAPYSKRTLKKGMVITIEPGIYLPKIGGIRIEDSIMITQNDYELLTKNTKKMQILSC